jgi:hypothetical protein
MKKILSVLALTSMILGFGLSTARAEVFVVGNQAERFTVTFPDTWMMIHNQQPDDELTIVAPGEGEFAQCRVRVRDDRRFLVYPPKLAANVQQVAYSKEFWFEYMNEYNDPYISSVTDLGGLGRGFASYAVTEFDTSSGPSVHKRGISFVSLYHDKAYIVDCSAEASVYDKWHNSFLSVIKSVDFGKTIHELRTGHYRDFLAGDSLQINGRRPVDVTFH